MSKCCWKNGDGRLAQCRVATNLQFKKKAVSVNCNIVKHNEMRYACIYNCLAMDWTVSSKFVCWSPNHQCNGFWRWGLCKVIRFQWGQEGGALMTGLVPFWEVEGTPEGSLCHVRTQQEGRHLQARKRGPSPDLNCAGILISAFQLSGEWEINFCYLSHPVYGILSWKHEQTKTNCKLQTTQMSISSGVHK